MRTLLLALLLAQDVTKDDVVRLTKEGKPEAEILKAIGPARFKLSADDVIELKKAGVAEAVLARMIGGPAELAVENRAHKPVRIRVQGDTIEVGVGEELRPGQSIRLPGAGEFAVTVDGRPRSVRVKTPASLTFRGCDVEAFEVLTLFIEGPAGSDTCVVENRVKEPRPSQPLPPPLPPRRIGRGTLDRTMDAVGRMPGAVADVLFGW
jgi:hypothetical protein